MVSNIFYFHPFFGEDFQFDEYFFRWVETTNQDCLIISFWLIVWQRISFVRLMNGSFNLLALEMTGHVFAGRPISSTVTRLGGSVTHVLL